MSLRELDRSKEVLPSSPRTLPMSKSLPLSKGGADGRLARNGVLHSSQSYSGRASIMTYHNQQFPSASAALNEYISDFEQQQFSTSQPTYRVWHSSKLLLPSFWFEMTHDYFHYNPSSLIDDYNL